MTSATSAPQGRLSVSIVISSYNYEPYLAASIGSALAQRVPASEVVVVDDGSTDGSASVARCYEGRADVVLQRNEGQASAWTAGFARTRGDLVVFLDSDDVLDEGAVEAVTVAAAGRPGISKVHWPVSVVDRNDRPTGRQVPGRVSDGDVLPAVLESGPATYSWPPSSGNAWSRSFLETVMPLPASYRTCPDLYLSALAPVYGPVVAIDVPLSRWRLHGRNHSTQGSAEAVVRRERDLWERCRRDFLAYCARRGVAADDQGWRSRSFAPRRAAAVAALVNVMPADSRLALLDEDQWALRGQLGGGVVQAFPQLSGVYAGPPANGEELVSELEQIAAMGITHVAVGWPAFWWLDHYPQLSQVLARMPLALDTPDVKLFELSVAALREPAQ